MAKRYLLGNEAIAHACIEAGVDFASGYPGTPSSEVIDTLRAQREREFYIEWSVNEKVAYENALAASWCGLRSIVTMKHVGLNVAADPLLTSAYTGVEGGFVVLSADDPYAHSSQNEQDTRRYAHFAKIPCMNPSSVQEAHDMMLDAFALSEEVGLPVIFRPTTRICHSKGDIDLGEVSGEHRAGAFVKDPRQYVVIPAHTRVLHKILNEKQPMVRKAVMNLGYNTAEVRGDMAVVASGIAASYVQEVIPDDVSFMKIGCFPIDGDWMQAFVQQHRVVLVVEEGAPIVEERLRQLACGVEVFGQMNGAVPKEGEFSPATVAASMVKAGILPASPFESPAPAAGLPPRPPILCAGCAHRAMFYAIKRVFPDGIFPSDIGCYTLGLQLGTVDTTICMGASVTVGSGIAHSGETHPVVATIGDSTFLHTGIQGLLNAVYNGAEMTLVILDNRITAMTGHQPNPCTGETARGEPSVPISLEGICRACGASFVETVDPYDLTGTLQTLKAAKARSGTKVIIAKQACVITARRSGVRRGRYTVDPEACTACGACLRFGCPAIGRDADEKASITDLCSGCGVCTEICPSGAIVKEGRK
ncbi:indolepyruvate ferredoxin oxidoreductase, alpha subunit [Methanofollis liminatans DSM 4140]|uniref:Indolepyruvate oxidoreductase subunit IorA n=1 Tax=Methanofollis liminatans DSM 4140 TaxID=28892 RepID=J0S916_9EURY|nr:indolepyruvate ferredoxin oxidoreductase subunit alpha [Methanofollis liminatans]EJG07099.1 indolepyruvate ferredoxin oxidoreductase, alpha subunit [Methanofollis liminatans DSM 4140]